MVAEQSGEGGDGGDGRAGGECLDNAEADTTGGLCHGVDQQGINGGTGGALEGETGDIGFAVVNQHGLEQLKGTGAGRTGGGPDGAEALTGGLTGRD